MRATGGTPIGLPGLHSLIGPTYCVAVMAHQRTKEHSIRRRVGSSLEATGELERILHDVSVGVLMSIYQDVKTRLGPP